jgi:hypothetical protein
MMNLTMMLMMLSRADDDDDGNVVGVYRKKCTTQLLARSGSTAF